MPDEGRRRLRNALLRPGRSQLVVGLVMAVLGFAFVVQVKDFQRDDMYAGLRDTELIGVLDGLTGRSERARREVSRLEETRDDLLDESSARSAALTEAEQRATNLSILAGLVPVEGPGIRVTITETTGRVSVGPLLDMVQELRTAGAEAMEFNDTYRLAAQSSFNSATGGIELDGHLLEAPYVLEVIGDPHVLKGALVFATGPVETLENYDGASVEIEQLDRLEIRSVRELVRPEHAEPAPSQ
jgi:uncharacterized protein YlxW (UPF0749 family)